MNNQKLPAEGERVYVSGNSGYSGTVVQVFSADSSGRTMVSLSECNAAFSMAVVWLHQISGYEGNKP